MSLDVYIIYQEPKKVQKYAGINQSACGSTVAIYPKDTIITETEWHANITHNMGKMADHIPTHYKIGDETYESDLYSLVWKPEEIGIGNICNNTDVLVQALQIGISYMVAHRDELLKYNPKNGWGDYDSFLTWLIDYWRACLDNPNCKIETSR